MRCGSWYVLGYNGTNLWNEKYEIQFSHGLFLVFFFFFKIMLFNSIYFKKVLMELSLKNKKIIKILITFYKKIIKSF